MGSALGRKGNARKISSSKIAGNISVVLSEVGARILGNSMLKKWSVRIRSGFVT